MYHISDIQKKNTKGASFIQILYEKILIKDTRFIFLHTYHMLKTRSLLTIISKMLKNQIQLEIEDYLRPKLRKKNTNSSQVINSWGRKSVEFEQFFK